MIIEDRFQEALNALIKKSDSDPAFACLIVRNGQIVASGFAHKSTAHDVEVLLIHAEEAALLDALQNQVSIEGADLYVLGIRATGDVRHTDKSYCCLVCSRLLLQTKIQNVFFPTTAGWDRMSVAEMFRKATSRLT